MNYKTKINKIVNSLYPLSIKTVKFVLRSPKKVIILFIRFLRSLEFGIRPEAKSFFRQVAGQIKNPKAGIKRIRNRLMQLLSKVRKVLPKIGRFSFRYLLPVFFAFLAFFIARPALADITLSDIELVLSLAEEKVVAGAEAGENDMSQIYYQYGTEKKFNTKNNYPSASPVIEADNVVWMSQIDGVWQIFLHNIVSEQTTQLTFAGNNVNPKLNEGKVVWECNRDEAWQICLYDGVGVAQITEGDMSIGPDMDNGYVVYSRMDDLENWRIEGYWISAKESALIYEGEGAHQTRLQENKIYIGVPGVDERRHTKFIDKIFAEKLNPETPVGGEVTPEDMLREMGGD